MKVIKMHPYRTHNCNELSIEHVGSKIRISGWVHRIRDHGGVMFVDLRDHYGVTQCVMEPANEKFKEFEALRPESVIRVDGIVSQRPGGSSNENRDTGEIEIDVTEFGILSSVGDLPLPVFSEIEYPEEIRLEHRYLDLRRERIHNNIIMRAQITSLIRKEMEAAEFIEIQTPILTASSPEGARDFVVPSRLHAGKFYALPQAPQIFKQLLMVSGFDKYFQIAPCFRDEDPRADRSPGEFYQLDFEMSLATQNDVFKVAEKVFTSVLETCAPHLAVSGSEFPQITYADALLKYGTDKPDLRIPMEISDVTDIFLDDSVEFKAFKNAAENDGVVRAIPAPGAGSQPRKFFDKLNDWAISEHDAPGLGYIILENIEEITAKGPIAKFIPTEMIKEICDRTNSKQGDAVFFSAGSRKKAIDLAGAVRKKIAEELNLIEENSFRLCWIVDFPMYDIDESTNMIEFSHNPFSMPKGGIDILNELPPLEILAHQYDLVGNGYELASGAVRNNSTEGLIKAFNIAGYESDEVKQNFAALTTAFQYGAPPHAGMAVGIERLIMLLAGEANLREVTAFPKNQNGEDLLMRAPAEISPNQLQELHVKISLPKKDAIKSE